MRSLASRSVLRSPAPTPTRCTVYTACTGVEPLVAKVATEHGPVMSVVVVQPSLKRDRADSALVTRVGIRQLSGDEQDEVVLAAARTGLVPSARWQQRAGAQDNMADLVAAMQVAVDSTVLVVVGEFLSGVAPDAVQWVVNLHDSRSAAVVHHLVRRLRALHGARLPRCFLVFLLEERTGRWYQLSAVKQGVHWESSSASAVVGAIVEHLSVGLIAHRPWCDDVTTELALSSALRHAGASISATAGSGTPGPVSAVPHATRHKARARRSSTGVQPHAGVEGGGDSGVDGAVSAAVPSRVCPTEAGCGRVDA